MWGVAYRVIRAVLRTQYSVPSTKYDACRLGAMTVVTAALLTTTAFAQTDLEKALETPIDEALDSPAATRPGNPPAETPEVDADDVEEKDILGGTVGFEAGLSRAQVDGKPALVFVTGENCPWCHRLKQEMQRSPAREALGRWTLIYVDIDQSPDAAVRLGVGAIPALRILRTSGAKVAARDGFVPGAALVKWLDDHYRSAAAEADNVLVGGGEPDVDSLVRLIGHLEDRDPLVREAAIARLATVPRRAGEPLVAAFSKGNLSTRLAAMEILSLWDAPVDDVDPWRPETVDDESLARLSDWHKQLESSTQEPSPLAASQLTDKQLADVQPQIERLLKLSVAEGAAIRARLSRHGATLLPEVYRRLEAAETDDAREKLLALRYRLVAGDALVLRFPGGLGRLASHDAQIRRQAAEKLAALAAGYDQPLLLELFSDPDPLIREIALRGLQQAGGAAATAALVRLLGDPEPNVRAAVLKQLTERASKSMVKDVAEYVKSEQDADLLVHAIRYLREVKGESTARALLPLLNHDAWQVRAETAEALHEIVDDDLDETNPGLAADVYAGLIGRLGDDDPFVVSRAVDGLEYSVTEIAIEPLLAAAEKHPQLAPQIIAAVAGNGKSAKKVRDRLNEFTQHAEPSIRAAAVAGLHSVSPETMAQWGTAALRDEDQSVRLAAADVFFQSLDAIREAKQESLIEETRGVEFDSFAGGYRIQSVRPSLIDRAIEALLPDADGDVVVPEAELTDELPVTDERDPFDDTDEPKAPRDVTPAPPAASQDEPSGGPQELPSDERWDEWLAGFHEGKGRAKGYDDLLEPLRQVLRAEDPKERLAAALVLIPLGKMDEALPVLRECVMADNDLFGESVKALPWLFWEQRKELFEQLRPLADRPKVQLQLVRAMTSAIDRRAADLFWQMLADDDVDVQLASTLSDGLLAAYHGERYYADEAAEPLKAKVVADAQARLDEGSELERLVGLVQLAHVDKPIAAAAAKKVAEDKTAPAALQEDAFQIALATSEREARLPMALAAFEGEDTQRQSLALSVLVMGTGDLNYVRGDAFYIPVVYDSQVYYSSDRGPIIPTPPDGVEPDHVRPLLAHADPKTRAYAGYVLALSGEKEGLDALLQYWNGEGRQQRGIEKLVYRAIAKQNAGEHLPLLREMYAGMDEYDVGDFYWTIRIMSGDDVLRFRKEIRNKFGISNLR